MQGYRIHMEDSHTHILSLPDDPGTSFFAVYDGHGGANIGKYASKHLHKFITKRPEYQTDVTAALKLVCSINSFIRFHPSRNTATQKQQPKIDSNLSTYFCVHSRRHFWILTMHCSTKRNWSMRWAAQRPSSHSSKTRNYIVQMLATHVPLPVSMVKYVNEFLTFYSISIDCY